MALSEKLEQAMVAVATSPVTAAVASAEVVPGMNWDTKTMPVVICSAEDGEGEEDPKGTGNFWKRAMVQVRHSAERDEDSQTPQPPDPTIEAKALIDAAFGAFLQSNIADLLTASGPDNFTVFPNGVIFEAPRRYQDADGAWIDELQFKAYCCEADFPN